MRGSTFAWTSHPMFAPTQREAPQVPTAVAARQERPARAGAVAVPVVAQERLDRQARLDRAVLQAPVLRARVVAEAPVAPRPVPPARREEAALQLLMLEFR